MRKLKEVLRLQSKGLSQHQIARSCSISQSTVHAYVSAAQAAGVKWPLPENWNDQQIEQAVFPQRPDPGIWRVDGGEKPGHFGGMEIGHGVGYASDCSKPERRPGADMVLLRSFLCGFGLRSLLSQPSAIRSASDLQNDGSLDQSIQESHSQRTVG